jgi:hypothetical protein
VAERLRKEAAWLDWDLEISYHAHKRSGPRGFSEADLRTMIADATGFVPSQTAGRYIVHSTFGKEQWRIVVEPDDEEHALIVVTAWRVWT